jgi:hypothetical protein
MFDVTSLTAEQILAIPNDVPEKLFTGSVAEMSQEYRALTKRWHPRLETDDSRVISHVNWLHDLAQQKLKDGTWQVPGTFSFTDVKTSKPYSFTYKTHHPFELGSMYVGQFLILYVINKDASDLFRAGLKQMRSFKYRDKKLEDAVKPLLPEVRAEYESATHHLLMVNKDHSLFSLQDVLDYYKGKVDPKHVAWIVTRLYHVCSYLYLEGITHNAISPSSLFIAPKTHKLTLQGWWYTQREHSPIVAVPARTLNIVPILKSDKTAHHKVDAELIKLTARELLGDGGGSKLIMDTNIPNALLSWARSPGTGRGVEDYQDWTENILPASFGERKFIEMKLTEADIYT